MITNQELWNSFLTGKRPENDKLKFCCMLIKKKKSLIFMIEICVTCKKKILMLYKNEYNNNMIRSY